MVRTVPTTCVSLLLLTQLAAGQAVAGAEVTAHAGSAMRLMQYRLYGEAAVEFEKALAIDPTDDAVV